MSENVSSTETNNSNNKRCKLVPLSGLRVFELKEELGKRGLDKTGIKVALIERLLMAIRSEGHNPETHQFSVVEYSKDTSSSSTPLQSPSSTPPQFPDEQNENNNETKDSNVLNSSETTASHPESPLTVNNEDSHAKEVEVESELNEQRKECDKIGDEDIKNNEEQIDTPQESNVKNDNDNSNEERSVNTTGQGQSQGEDETTMRSARSSSSSPQNHYSLWVRGIDANTKASDLKNLFSRCGHVINSKIFIRRQQPKNLYIGYVTMVDLECAKRSMKTLNKTVFNNHLLNIQLVDKSKAFSIKAKNAAKTQFDVKKSSDNPVDHSPVEKNDTPQSDSQPNENVSEQQNTSSSDNELHIDEKEESPEKENSELKATAEENVTMTTGLIKKEDIPEETNKDMVINDIKASEGDRMRTAEDVVKEEVKDCENVQIQDPCSENKTDKASPASPSGNVEKESSTSNINTSDEIMKQTQPKLTNELLKSNNSLWIQGISSDTKAAHLKTMFSKCGRVLTSKIFVKRQQTSISYFGFVAMIDSQCADECVKQFHNAVLNGQQISVERADCVDMAVRIPAIKKKSESDTEQATSSGKDLKNLVRGDKNENKKGEKNPEHKKPSSSSDKETKLGKRPSSHRHHTSQSSGSNKQAILISSRAIDEYEWRRRKVLQMRQAARKYHLSIRPPPIPNSLLVRTHKRDKRFNRSSMFLKPRSGPIPLSTISPAFAAKTSRSRLRSSSPGPSNIMRSISRRKRLSSSHRSSPPYHRPSLMPNPPSMIGHQNLSSPHPLLTEDDRLLRHHLSPRAISPPMLVDDRMDPREIGRDVPLPHYRRHLSSRSRSRSRESRLRFSQSSPTHILPWSHDMSAARKEDDEQLRIREEERALHEERSRLKRERERIERERKMIEKEQLTRQLRLKADMEERAAQREQEISLQREQRERVRDVKRKHAKDGDRTAKKGLLNTEMELAQRERLGIEQKRLELERVERERMAERIAIERRNYAAERDQRRMRKERLVQEKLKRENERMDHFRTEEEREREERLRLERERMHGAGERVDRAERFKLEHQRIAEQQRMHKEHERQRISGAGRDALRSKRVVQDSVHVEEQQNLTRMERELMEKERVERVSLRPKRMRRDSSNVEKRRIESLSNDNRLRNAEPSRHKPDLSSSPYKGYSAYDEDTQIKKQLSYIEREKMELEQLRKLTEITTSSMLSSNFGSSSNCIADNNFIKGDHNIDHYRYYDERNVRSTDRYPDFPQDDRMPNHPSLSNTIASGNVPSPSRYDSQRQYQNLRRDMASTYPYNNNPSDQQNAAYDYRCNVDLQSYAHQEPGYNAPFASRTSERDLSEYNRYTTIDSGHQRGDSYKDAPLNTACAPRYTSLSSPVASRGPWTSHISPIDNSSSGNNNNANQAITTQGGLKSYIDCDANPAVDSNKWQWSSSSSQNMQQRYVGANANVSSKWPISQQGMWRNDDKSIDRNEAPNTASFINEYEPSYPSQGTMSKRALELRDALRKSYVGDSNAVDAYDVNPSKNIPSLATSSRYRSGVNWPSGSARF